MPTYTGTPGALASADTNCGKSGLRTAWLTTFASLASITESEGTITAFTMATSAKFYKVEFEAREGASQAEYTPATGVYEAVATNLRFLGRSAVTRLQIDQWIAACKLVLVVEGADGVREIFGLENANSVLTTSAKPGRIERVLHTAGERGAEDNPARAEIDFRAEHDYAPLLVSSAVNMALLV